MISVVVAVIYGIGLGVTLGGMLITKMFLQALEMPLSRKHPMFWEVALVVAWPITWAFIVYGLWKLYKEQTKYPPLH